MADLIDREKVIEAIDDISVEVDEGYGFQYEKWRKYFCELSSVPRKGKWVLDNPHSEIYRYACSECHAHHRARYDFCPSCGADMREGDLK